MLNATFPNTGFGQKCNLTRPTAWAYDNTVRPAQITQKARDSAAADHDIAYWLATAYVLLGRRDDALHWLETAVKLGNENYPWFTTDKCWTSLHDDPRFLAVIDRIKTEHQNEDKVA